MALIQKLFCSSRDFEATNILPSVKFGIRFLLSHSSDKHGRFFELSKKFVLIESVESYFELSSKFFIGIHDLIKSFSSFPNPVFGKIKFYMIDVTKFQYNYVGTILRVVDKT